MFPSAPKGQEADGLHIYNERVAQCRDDKKKILLMVNHLSTLTTSYRRLFNFAKTLDVHVQCNVFHLFT